MGTLRLTAASSPGTPPTHRPKVTPSAGVLSDFALESCRSPVGLCGSHNGLPLSSFADNGRYGPRIWSLSFSLAASPPPTAFSIFAAPRLGVRSGLLLRGCPPSLPPSACVRSCVAPLSVRRRFHPKGAFPPPLGRLRPFCSLREPPPATLWRLYIQKGNRLESYWSPAGVLLDLCHPLHCWQEIFATFAAWISFCSPLLTLLAHSFTVTTATASVGNLAVSVGFGNGAFF